MGVRGCYPIILYPLRKHLNIGKIIIRVHLVRQDLHYIYIWVRLKCTPRIRDELIGMVACAQIYCVEDGRRL